MKKTLALLLALVMVVALFAGCSGQTPSTNDPGDSTPSSTPSTPNDYDGPYPVDENGQFIYGDRFKDVTVSIVSITDVDDDHKWIYEQIEKRIGCKIDVIEIPSDVHADKLSAMLADNNLPTMFESFTSITKLVEYGEQGAFVDVLDPENLAKMPAFAKFFVENEEVYNNFLKTAAEDGSHYILPVYDSERAVNHYWIYNETAFEEAGVEWAGDPEGFMQMLRDLKAYFPGSYPLTGGAYQGTLDRMIYTWGVNSSYAAYDYETNEWYYGATTDAYYDMMSLLRDAYNEGLMNPDMLTQGNGAIQEDMVKREGFLYNSWLGWMTMHNAAFADGGMSDHEIPTPTPVGPNGKTLELSKYSVTNGVVISNADPLAAEAAMAIINWMYDDSEYGGAWINTVGDASMLKTDENGKLNWIDESMPNGVNNDINYVFDKYGMFQTTLSVRYAPESPYFTFNEEEQMAQEIGEQIGYVKCPPPVVLTDVEIADAYTASQQDIKAMQQKFVIDNWGRAEFDAWAQDFLETYGEVIEYLNEG